MIGEPEVTTHGNYRCPYCPRRVTKIRKPMVDHIEQAHQSEISLLGYKKQLESLEQENKKLKEQLKSKKREYYNAIWYCANCLELRQGGLPKNVLLKNVLCGKCGSCSLHIVTNVSSFWTKL